MHFSAVTPYAVDSPFSPNDLDPDFTDAIGVGVVTRLIDRDLVDEVLADTGRREQRARLLPARVVVYLVLALALFSTDAYEEVVRKLTNGLRGLRIWRNDWKVPGASAISQARTRLGSEPLAALFTRVCVPTATASTPGAFYAGLRVMTVDGTMVDVPDTPENVEAFGKYAAGRNRARFRRSNSSRWWNAGHTPRSGRRWMQSPSPNGRCSPG